MNSKFKIKLGQIELEYEGNEEFLKKELPELLAMVSKLFKETGAAALITNTAESKLPNTSQQHGSSHPAIKLTTGSIASKLKADSGSDLLIAAAAHLALVKEQKAFTRSELLKEMQSATTFYKKTYNNNLTKILATVISGDKLREVASGSYSLSEATLNKLRTDLA